MNTIINHNDKPLEILIFEKLKSLDLLLDDELSSKNIIDMAISSIYNFICIEINPFIDFNSISNIFIDVTISEYLSLIKNSNLQSQFDFSSTIKSIKEGDTSITYFDENSSNSFQSIIDYFNSKKVLLYNYKVVKW